MQQCDAVAPVFTYSYILSDGTTKTFYSVNSGSGTINVAFPSQSGTYLMRVIGTLQNNQFADTFITLIGDDPFAPKFTWTTLPLLEVPMSFSTTSFDYAGKIVTNPTGSESLVVVSIPSMADGSLIPTPSFISHDTLNKRINFNPTSFGDVGTY